MSESSSGITPEVEHEIEESIRIFRENAAEALDTYMYDRRLQNTGFGKQLGLHRSKISSVRNGKAVLEDVADYARLYNATGLAELDPRIIPPKIWTTPRTRAIVNRSWDDDQLESWLEQQGSAQLFTPSEPDVPKEKKLSKPSARKAVQPTPKDDQLRSQSLTPLAELFGSVFEGSADQKIGRLVLDLVEVIGQQIANDVSDRLQTSFTPAYPKSVEPEPEEQVNPSAELSQVAKTTRQLIKLFNKYLTGPSKERDKLAGDKQLGQDLAKLYMQVELLLQPKSDRESSLADMTEVELS